MQEAGFFFVLNSFLDSNLECRARFSLLNGTNVQPDIQQQIDFIKAKAREQNINIIKHPFDKNDNIMSMGLNQYVRR